MNLDLGLTLVNIQSLDSQIGILTIPLNSGDDSRPK